MSNFYDLSGILALQRNAIIDISQIYKGSTASVSNELSLLQGNLNALATSYQTASSAVGATLTEQRQIQDIVNSEKSRLDAKKNDIENKLEYTRRMLSLNDSATKRRRDYMKIIMVLVGILIVYIAIIKLSQYSIIPSFISELLIILLIGIGVIYIFILWRGINVRNNMDHDKLNIPPPNTLSPEELAKVRERNAAAGSLTGASANPNACVGQVCCSTGNIWEVGVNRCIVPPNPIGAGGNVRLVGASITLNVSGADISYNDGAQIPLGSCTGSVKVCGNACIPVSSTCLEAFTPNIPSEYVTYSVYSKK